MSSNTPMKIQRVYSDVDTTTLKGVYILALEILNSTYHVDERAMVYLAEAVFATYADSRAIKSLSQDEAIEVAALSVDLFKQSRVDALYMRH